MKPVFPSMLFDTIMNALFERSDGSGTVSSRNPSSSREIKRVPPSLAGRIHVLVAEDNRINQIVAKNLIEEAGITCDIVGNGYEACAAVRQKHYDIVLMDCQMPEMDGYEATDLIRKWELEQGKNRIPIIALTANATKEDVQKCFDSGMDAYCSKPINPKVLFKEITRLFGENAT